MADIEFNLGNPDALDVLAAPNVGGTVALPVGLPAASGVYIIWNHDGPTNNCYMGISTDIRTRFGPRQGAVFELGLRRAQLQNLDAFCSTMRYRSTGGNTSTHILNPGATWV